MSDAMQAIQQIQPLMAGNAHTMTQWEQSLVTAIVQTKRVYAPPPGWHQLTEIYEIYEVLEGSFHQLDSEWYGQRCSKKRWCCNSCSYNPAKAMGRSLRCCSWNDILQVSFSTPTGWKYFVEDGSGIWFLWNAPFECACMHAIAWQDMGPAAVPDLNK